MDSVMIEEKVLKLNKSNWLPSKLGDLATDISNRVDNPGESEYDRFVGLGNFVSGDIKIKSWETTEGLASSAKAFEVGDILFARRNAYLRRASMVDFDGCCSGDAFVLRENHDKVVPGFLAFLLNSDALWDYANSNAAGTMSKRVKWRDLAEYEFLLPPKDQQAKLAELLWAMDEVIENELILLKKIDIIYERFLFDFFENDSNYKKVELGDLVNIKSGDSPSTFNFTNEKNGYPFYKVKDLNESDKFQTYAKEWVKPIDSKIIKKGSVIFPKRGAAIMTNKVRITTEECHVDTNTMALFIKDYNILSNEFLYYFLYFKKLFKIADTSQIPQINNVHINPYPINLPPILVQINFVNKLNEVLKSRGTIENKIDSSKALQKSLINQVF
jgi:type I restriction enzyme S subunit